MGDGMDIPLPKSDYELDIVLVGVNHPGNLGAVCRTMLNHGYDKLSLVSLTAHLKMKKRGIGPNTLGRILDTGSVRFS